MRPNCSDIQEALSLLVAGELPEAEAKGVLDHVGSCAECSRLHARFQRQNQLFRAATTVLGADELKLMALRARTSSGASVGELRRQRFLAAAAVVLALLIPAATYFLFTPPQEGPPALDAVAMITDEDI
jgi:anti-sigma factor RsiW